MEKTRRQALLSWMSVGLLAVLCAILAVLQYRWIGEISRGEKERLRLGLQRTLSRLSRDFNSEINSAWPSLQPRAAEIEKSGRDAAYLHRIEEWKSNSRRPALLRNFALAIPHETTIELRRLDTARNAFAGADWPDDWSKMKARLLARMQGGPPPPLETSTLIEMPRFVRQDGNPVRFRRSEMEWLIAEVDESYIRSTLLPELLERHLGSEYRAQVVWRGSPTSLLYTSDGGARFAGGDGSVTLFEGQFGRPAPDGARPAPPPVDSGRGRWLLTVQHRAGSLETIVAGARARNLAVSAGLLLLLGATVAALVRFSRQAQRLADLQMDFVAGVSHELRTPLSVIRTAAFNLRGKLSGNQSQVERYGALIQHESEKLTAIVEQVMRFASANAARVIHETEPVSVEGVIEESLLASRSVIEGAGGTVDKRIEPGLPPILGDAMALRHALQNLIANALKYGSNGEHWIGLTAALARDRKGPVVEIRVADRGPGIPAEEQRRVFDPFFRGKRAVSDQVHGTGLGLNLVKKIVEAHGGTVTVSSEPMKGAEFVLRIPAAPIEKPVEHGHELAHPVG
ncbi:MAG: sensor histidine kinase [Bryobacteraceae bacterium]